MTDQKVKLYKNKERNSPEPLRSEGYVPQYAQLGIEPIVHGGKSIAGKPMIVGSGGQHTLPLDNPRANRPIIRQPYAETAASPLGRGKGLLPNVGNNVEQTWAVVDGQIIDDVGLDDIQPMIDNNDIVSNQALGLSPAEEILQVSERDGQLDNASVLQNLANDEYLVLVGGEPVASGSLDAIQSQVSSLVFGDHQFCQGEPVDVAQLVVVKKVKINIGVFLKG